MSKLLKRWDPVSGTWVPVGTPYPPIYTSDTPPPAGTRSDTLWLDTGSDNEFYPVPITTSHQSLEDREIVDAHPQYAEQGHNIGGDAHSADTLVNLNTKVSDATLDSSSDTRTPTVHGDDLHEEGIRKVSFYGPQLTNEGSLDLSVWDSNPKNLKFSPDGLVMYLVGGTSAAIFQFDLAVAWDVTTATLDGSFDVSAEEGQPAGLMFKPDGTVMYVTGAWSDSVDQYNLSTAWDVTTAVTNGSLSVAAEETSPSGLNFNADGSRLFVIGTSSDKIWTYLLSTAWDITTGSVSGGGFVLTSQNTVPKNLEFSPDGYKAYVADGRKIFEYSLKTAYGVGTGGGDYYGTIYSVEDDTTSVGGGTFGNDGKRLYVTTFVEKLLIQYDFTL